MVYKNTFLPITQKLEVQMKDKIKTREVVKDIKVHDSAVNVGDRMKNVGV